MAAQKLYKFTVEGVGHFPNDMLRYDACWPRSEEDSSAMFYHVRDFDTLKDSLRKITLLSIHEPTEGRWRSFGWRITAESVKKVA